MSVYEDMANDAGYSYGTDENKQMAMMIEYEEQSEYFKQMEEYEAMKAHHEVLFRNFKKEEKCIIGK